MQMRLLSITSSRRRCFRVLISTVNTSEVKASHGEGNTVARATAGGGKASECDGGRIGAIPLCLGGCAWGTNRRWLGGGSGTSFRPVLAMYEGCVREGGGGGGDAW
jgi:hypothetical protein